MIHVRDVSVAYGDQPALADINLNVRPGESVLITGPSGCGKSTLARLICGLIPHAIPAQVTGEVSVAGLEVARHSLPDLAQRVGMVFQNPSAHFFHLRVEDEVAFGPRNLGWDEESVRQAATWALEATGLAHLRGRRPTELSGGQKQRLAVATALAMRPKLLVLDEPTSSLDVPGTRGLVTALRRLQQEEGVTLLIIEHRLREVAGLAERVVLMDVGRIVADGPAASILDDYPRLRSLGLRRPLERSADPWQTLLGGGKFDGKASEPLLMVNDVTAGYGRTPVLQGVNLALYPGDFAALVGDNGAGKSTLARVIAGLVKPQQGSVRFTGCRRPRPGQDVALLFQNPTEQLFTDTVDDEVAFGPRNLGCADPAAHHAILEQLNLSDLRHRQPLTLSMGQQQRTALAALLVLRPRLVILDEPTQGQDWGHLERLRSLLKAINDQGTAILLISHDYKLIHRCARRVIWLQNGQIRADNLLSTDIGAGR